MGATRRTGAGWRLNGSWSSPLCDRLSLSPCGAVATTGKLEPNNAPDPTLIERASWFRDSGHMFPGYFAGAGPLPVPELPPAEPQLPRRHVSTC